MQIVPIWHKIYAYRIGLGLVLEFPCTSLNLDNFFGQCRLIFVSYEYYSVYHVCEMKATTINGIPKVHTEWWLWNFPKHNYDYMIAQRYKWIAQVISFWNIMYWSDYCNRTLANVKISLVGLWRKIPAVSHDGNTERFMNIHVNAKVFGISCRWAGCGRQCTTTRQRALFAATSVCKHWRKVSENDCSAVFAVIYVAGTYCATECLYGLMH